jgi:hypothetical protein
MSEGWKDVRKRGGRKGRKEERRRGKPAGRFFLFPLVLVVSTIGFLW